MSSLRESIRAGVSNRYDFPLVLSKSALLIIDVQKYCCDGDVVVIDDDERNCRPNPSPQKEYFYNDEALPRMKQNIRDLLSKFREQRDCSYCTMDDTTTNINETKQKQQQYTSIDITTGGFPEVIFVMIQSMTKDGRDMSIDYKLSGQYFRDIPNVTMTYDEIFLDEYDGCLKPNCTKGRGDIVVPKTACSAFSSTNTNLDMLLRNLFVEQLVICGQLTDQCVESTVRDAADLGYLVTVAEDACAAHTNEQHQKGLSGMKGFCRILSTDEILQEINNN
jgi:nicotinamidase-related amidase